MINKNPDVLVKPFLQSVPTALHSTVNQLHHPLTLMTPFEKNFIEFKLYQDIVGNITSENVRFITDMHAQIFDQSYLK